MQQLLLQTLRNLISRSGSRIQIFRFLLISHELLIRFPSFINQIKALIIYNFFFTDSELIGFVSFELFWKNEKINSAATIAVFGYKEGKKYPGFSPLGFSDHMAAVIASAFSAGKINNWFHSVSSRLLNWLLWNFNTWFMSIWTMLCHPLLSN